MNIGRRVREYTRQYGDTLDTYINSINLIQRDM